MAPRRGGGSYSGSSYGSSISVSNKCSQNNAFQDHYSRRYLALFAVFFLNYLIASLLLCVIRVKNAKVKQGLGWSFALSLLCVILYFALSIIDICLNECRIYDDPYDTFKMEAASQWFYQLASYLLLYNLCLALGSSLRSLVRLDKKALSYTFSFVLSVLACLLLSNLSLLTYNDSRYNYRSALSGDLQGSLKASMKFLAAYFVLLFVASLLAVVFLVFSLFRMSGHNLASGSLKLWVPLIATCFPCFILISAIWQIHYNVQYHNPKPNTILSVNAAQWTLLAVTYWSILWAANSQVFKTGITTIPYDPNTGTPQIGPPGPAKPVTEVTATAYPTPLPPPPAPPGQFYNPQAQGQQPTPQQPAPPQYAQQTQFAQPQQQWPPASPPPQQQLYSQPTQSPPPQQALPSLAQSPPQQQWAQQPARHQSWTQPPPQGWADYAPPSHSQTPVQHGGPSPTPRT